jgi:hypothetical protein
MKVGQLLLREPLELREIDELTDSGTGMHGEPVQVWH